MPPVDASAFALDPVGGRRSLTDRVHDRLRAAMLSGQLGPGTHLSVPALSRQLGVSRSPVRDALLRLEGEGLVRSTPHRGAVVLRPNVQDLRELFELREVLEGLAARLAAPRIGPSTIDSLRDALAHHVHAFEHVDAVSSIRYDLDFHRTIRAASASERLIASLDQLEDQIGLAIQTTAARRASVARALDEHRRLLLALERGDGDAAEAAARAHIRRVRETLLAAATEPPTPGRSWDTVVESYNSM